MSCPALNSPSTAPSAPRSPNSTQLFPADALADLAALAAELGSLDGYDGNPSRIAHCAGLNHPPQPVSAHLEHWRALIHLLITADDWRKERGINRKNLEFDYDRKHPNHLRLVAIIDRLSHRDDLLLAFQSVRQLPPAHYPPDQWAVTKSLFRVLSRALIELQIVFNQRGECDYTESTLLARAALTADSGPEDLAIALGTNLQHLLVDEMQDTSSIQYEIVELLTQSWDGHSQTVFLVGDPKQSIYLFRQARVERFIRVLQTQRLGDLPLTALRLTANFRSQGALVDQFNLDFDASSPALLRTPSPTPTPTPYFRHPPIPQASLARAPIARCPRFHPLKLHRSPCCVASRKQQARRDAREIRKIALHWLDKPLPEDRRRLTDGQPEPWRIAVLVSNRAHLDEIVVALKSTDEPSRAIPFRAIEIDALNQCQEVLDLAALTRALLHPADRVAWLALLRAPWCGLSLADLHALTGADDPELKRHSISRLIAERSHLLSEEGSLRLARIHSILQAAVAQRAHLTLAQLVERTWRSLGGDAWLGEPERINARRFLELLDALEGPGGSIDPGLFNDASESSTPNLTPFLRHLPTSNSSPSTKPRAWSGTSSLCPRWRADRRSTAATCSPGPRSTPMTRTHPSRLLRLCSPPSLVRAMSPTLCIAGSKASTATARPQSASASSTSPAPVPARSFISSPHPQPKSTASPASLPAACSKPHGPQPNLFPLARRSAARNPLNLTRDRGLRHRRCSRPAVPSSSVCPLPSIPLLASPPLAARSFPMASPLAPPTQANRNSHGLRVPSPRAPSAMSFMPAWRFSLPASPRATRPSACWLSFPPGFRASPRCSAPTAFPAPPFDRLTRETLSSLKNVLRDPDGLWLLAPHPCAASELAITAWPESRDASSLPASVRVDRVFHAGPEPRAPGEDSLWILDYKTAAHSGSSSKEFLDAQRVAYGPQLRALRPHPRLGALQITR